MTTIQLLPAILVAVTAACLGSFVCVVVDRMPYALDGPNEFGDSWSTRPWNEVVGGRSRCSTCSADVRAIDNVPVVGWLRLRGHCRSCGDRIPGYLPVVEVLLPLAGIWLLTSLGWGWRALPAWWLLPVGVAIAAIDLRAYIVPTRIVWPAWFATIGLSVASAGVTGEWRWMLGAALGAAVFAGPLFVVWFIHPRGLGFGDVRLAVLLGWTIGFVGAERLGSAAFLVGFSLGLAAVVATIGAFVALTFRGRNARVPFGPPLVLASLVTIAYAPEILHAFAIPA